MTEKSIKFNPEFIPAILAGQKTQTRRLVDPQPIWMEEEEGGSWIRTYDDTDIIFIYCSDSELFCKMLPINAPHQPGETLSIEGTEHKIKITSVRVERVQEINEDDAEQECPPLCCDICGAEFDLEANSMGCCVVVDCGSDSWSYVAGFKKLWDSIYPGSWDRNDWVYVYAFELEVGCNEKV